MDLDNTLVPWNDNAVVPEVMNWMRKLKNRVLKPVLYQ